MDPILVRDAYARHRPLIGLPATPATLERIRAAGRARAFDDEVD